MTISEGTLRRLEAIAQPGDSLESVLVRLLEVYERQRPSFSSAPGSRPGQQQAAGDAKGIAEMASHGGNGAGGSEAYTGRRPKAYRFRGNRMEVSTFKDVYLGICRELATLHADKFDQVLDLRGRQRAYFAKSAAGLTHPQRIQGTHIFAETNFSAENIVDRCKDVLGVFGYPPDSLSIELR